MSTLRLLVAAEAPDALLVLPRGPLDWGEIVTAGPADAALAFGEAEAPAGTSGARWLAHPGGSPRAGERLIAPAGDGLWMQAPWPVADEVFALSADRPPSPRVALVGGTPDERTAAVDALAERAVTATGHERLRADTLRASTVVALLGPPGGPLVQGAFATLAAGRLLIAPPSEPSFGLHAGMDHFVYENHDELVHTADMLFSHPRAWEPIRAVGRRVASTQRASIVLGRVARRLAERWSA